MEEVDAVFARAVSVATDIVQGRVQPHDGARSLWSMARDLEALVASLQGFIGLASEWEDAPERRAEYERDIVVAADRFVARFGK
jgi:hypothetical protein